MNNLLVDLSRHQAWADAEYWRALGSCPPALDDEATRKRLHHLHQVQRAFQWIVERRDPMTFPRTTPQDFPTIGALREFAKGASLAMAAFLDVVRPDRLEERVQLPFFPKDPPFTLTVGEALLQAVTHSQWHRGQNATRLRELGGEPPTIDLIIWYLKDRPAAEW
jgi:uncharacterized damage-inducible protein DinB